MTREDFLLKFQITLQRDEPLAMDMYLVDIEEWDSLATMATIVFLDKEFGVQVTIRDFDDIDKIEDIARKVGI